MLELSNIRYLVGNEILSPTKIICWFKKNLFKRIFRPKTYLFTKYMCQKMFGQKKMLTHKHKGLQKIGCKKFGQNRFSNSWDIPNMNKFRQDKCCI